MYHLKKTKIPIMNMLISYRMAAARCRSERGAQCRLKSIFGKKNPVQLVGAKGLDVFCCDRTKCVCIIGISCSHEIVLVHNCCVKGGGGVPRDDKHKLNQPPMYKD